MTDGHFQHIGDSIDKRSKIVEVQIMTSIDANTQRQCCFRCAVKGRSADSVPATGRLGIGARVQFNAINARFWRCSNCKGSASRKTLTLALMLWRRSVNAVSAVPFPICPSHDRWSAETGRPVQACTGAVAPTQPVQEILGSRWSSAPASGCLNVKFNGRVIFRNSANR